MDAAAEEALAIARVRSWLRTGRARQIREGARVSQADLGRAIGSDGPQISRWEAGKARPRRDYALKLARMLTRTGGDDPLRGRHGLIAHGFHSAR